MSTHEKFGIALAYIDSLNIPTESKDTLKGLVKEVKCEAFDFGYDVKQETVNGTKTYHTLECIPKEVIKDIVREVIREQQVNHQLGHII